ncbi:hypothetical protein Gasu2_01000 [Galdieria sulphuraria]|nr:hypothetical protein Gasu2_01000 [Galdieria sulphuraria]
MSALPMEEKAPFVNGSTIRQYVGKKVFIAGKVLSQREGTLLVQTSDQQQLQIFGSRCTVGDGVAVFCLVLFHQMELQRKFKLFLLETTLT